MSCQRFDTCQASLEQREAQAAVEMLFQIRFRGRTFADGSVWHVPYARWHSRDEKVRVDTTMPLRITLLGECGPR